MDSNRIDPLLIALEYEQQLGIPFENKSLLVRALTHRSYLNEMPLVHADNERLEFLGDAVLDLVVAEILYQRFPEQREGPLTAMRASLVRRETLAEFARKIDLREQILLGRGEEESGGRERAAILHAAFEALVGAIFLDSDLDTVTDFLLPFLEPEIGHLQSGRLHKDAKSRLQEWSQAEYGITPRYYTIGSEGPDHAKEFTIEVRIGERAFGEGKGNSKQRAAQAAAEAALTSIAKEKPREK
jgi:ribonuclease-3